MAIRRMVIHLLTAHLSVVTFAITHQAVRSQIQPVKGGTNVGINEMADSSVGSERLLYK